MSDFNFSAYTFSQRQAMLQEAVARYQVLAQSKAFYGYNANTDLILEYNATIKFILGLEESLGIPQTDSNVTEIAAEAQAEFRAQQRQFAQQQARQQAQQNLRYEQQAMTESVRAQFEQLRTVRQVLGINIEKVQKMGELVPNYVLLEIKDGRASIKRIKEYLRSKGFEVDDVAGDK